MACVRQPPSFDVLRSWAAFDGPVRSALHRLKYRRDLGAAEVFAQRLFDLYRQMGWDADWVVPVPLSAARLRKRGYNQAALIARPLAWLAGKPFRPRALVRVKATRSQVGLSREQRRENVRQAFRAEPVVAGKRILLVDDVATSGATLDAASNALRQAGAASVMALTVARALLSDSV